MRSIGCTGPRSTTDAVEHASRCGSYDASAISLAAAGVFHS